MIVPGMFGLLVGSVVGFLLWRQASLEARVKILEARMRQREALEDDGMDRLDLFIDAPAKWHVIDNDEIWWTCDNVSSAWAFQRARGSGVVVREFARDYFEAAT